MDKLRPAWAEQSRNTESLAELWIGLLRFYTEEFNFKDYVISIRQRTPLTRFEKLWNGRCMAIEDPFDLGHNLGGGLSRKMDNYIMKAFHNGRMLFGSSVNHVPMGYKSLEDYLFDPKLLTDTAPPMDRNCRRCGRIGHWSKQCPRDGQQRVANDDGNVKNNNQKPAQKQHQKSAPSSSNKNTDKSNTGGVGAMKSKSEEKFVINSRATALSRNPNDTSGRHRQTNTGTGSTEIH